MSKLFVIAVRYLARREHSVHELTQKIAQKGYEADEIQAVLAECQRLGLQSDERYAQSLCRTRIQQGYGPRRIRDDLLTARVDREIMDQVLANEQDHWLTYAQNVRLKKYSHEHDVSFASLQKQKQFLLYRGFALDTVLQVFKDMSSGTILI